MFGRKSKNLFHPASPILRVLNLQASIDHYVKVLGFTVDWQDPGIIGSVTRDRCNIMLAESDQGNPGSWVWIGVGDVLPLFEEFRTKGAAVRLPPTNFPWAYEMQIQDPDGNVLRFGSDPMENHPFGEWLDMRGRRWVKSPDGGWTQVEHD
ncbi:MAG: VOC family protein [Ignavibacteriales bacterium]|nr:VOC family protein [Ignavibacteriales bacterium]